MTCCTGSVYAPSPSPPSLGNARAVFRAMGIHPSTFYRWRHFGVEPRHLYQEFLAFLSTADGPLGPLVYCRDRTGRRDAS
jgi:hypothetical protein